MTLGDKIVKLRTEHHLSQGDLAEQLGVSRQSISKWETGNSIPDLDKLLLLSEVFGVSLDALVKDQEPEEAIVLPQTAAQQSAEAIAAQSVERYPPRKIAGWILLSSGLFSIVIGLGLQFPLLLLLGGYLLLCSMICLMIKKHAGLVIGWGTFIPAALYLPQFTSANMTMVFNPYVYRAGLGIQLIVSYVFWVLLFLLIFATTRHTRLKNHLPLVFGWVIFSQVHGFIPIGFQSSSEVAKAYLMFARCVTLLFLILLFFTGRALYRHFQLKKQV
jgi:transcriptional regulator with XRE-family HTH domain